MGETSAEWYAKATKKLKSTKSMDDNGVAKVKRTAKEHSDLWKSKHGSKDDVAKVAKADDKKLHGPPSRKRRRAWRAWTPSTSTRLVLAASTSRRARAGEAICSRVRVDNVS